MLARSDSSACVFNKEAILMMTPPLSFSRKYRTALRQPYMTLFKLTLIKRSNAFPDEASWNAMTETQLLKRVGSPMEIAYLALYLASDESGFTNGVSVIVDGGIHNSPATVVADE